jgi:archaellum biogenesis ATPase FlaH
MRNYLTNDSFKNKTIFFLDAHVDNINIHNYKKKCPLFNELEAIKTIERKDNIILVDDLRIIKSTFPGGETSYGNIDFLEQIKNVISTINENYKFSTLNGYIEDDVLLAYV